MTKLNEIYTTVQVAEILGVNRWRVWQLAKIYRVGKLISPRAYIFSGSDLAKLKDRRPGRPPLMPPGEQIRILADLEEKGLIADVSEARVVARRHKGDEFVCKIHNAEGRILYVVK